MLNKIFFLVLVIIVGIFLYIKREYNNDHYTESFYINSITQTYSLNGRKLKNNKLFSLEKHQKYLYDIINNQKTLIIIFDNVSCNLCIDAMFYECKKLISKDAKTYKKIIAIAYSDDINYLRRFVRINNLKFNIYWDKFGNIVNKMKFKHLPVALVLNENKEIINSIILLPQTKPLIEPFFIKAKNYLDGNF